MIYAALGMLLGLALLFCWWWRREALAAHRALREWRDRWNLAPALCAVTGCGEPREADCHIPADMEVRAPWGHRFLEARLVPAPEITVREGIGAYR